jgi:hypothetical protein
MKFSKSNSRSSKYNAALEREWKDTSLLIIDEISTVSCQLLGRVHERLNEISSRPKKKGEFFGGMHVLMCGDFHQIPPVSEVPLYARKATAKAAKGEHAMMGWSAWQSVKEAAFLTQQMRLRTDASNPREQAWQTAVQHVRNFDVQPEDKQTLINTAIRTVKALTGLDLSPCTQW